MRRLLELALVLVLIGSAASACAGEIIDRIVATVNGRAILQSDWEIAIRCEALMQGRPLESLTDDDQRATLERLIDQELLRQQMGKTIPGPSAEELAARIQQVRSSIPGGQNDDVWRAALTSHGLTESDVAERIAAQMQIGGFIDNRLRPGIHIESQAIQAYYREKFLPELRKTGVTTEPRLGEVAARIREILIQQRMSAELSTWLRSLREQADIRTSPSTTPAARPPDAKGGWKSPDGPGASGR
ncbi:MAG: SurA N-terminal domain-containing protein [Terriglobales bacterium]